MCKVYLASPLGFSPENLSYMTKIIVMLQSLGLTVINPWATDWSAEIAMCYALDSVTERDHMFGRLSLAIGRYNAAQIRRADVVLAVLDGTEPDSGTVCELGYAVGMGKRAYGLRTDLRDAGDFPGVVLNLQVLCFIEDSGGRLFRKIEDIDCIEAN